MLLGRLVKSFDAGLVHSVGDFPVEGRQNSVLLFHAESRRLSNCFISDFCRLRRRLVNKGFINGERTLFSCWTQRVIPTSVYSHARVAKYSAGFGSSCPLTESHTIKRILRYHRGERAIRFVGDLSGFLGLLWDVPFKTKHQPIRDTDRCRATYLINALNVLLVRRLETTG